MKEINRETPADLFKGILKMTRDSGMFKEIDDILEYADANRVGSLGCSNQITNNEFRVMFEMRRGALGGVFIGAYLVGFPFERNDEHQRLHFGTLKAAEDSFHTMEIMGRACGLLLFFANAYVAKNWRKYDPIRKK